MSENAMYSIVWTVAFAALAWCTSCFSSCVKERNISERHEMIQAGYILKLIPGNTYPQWVKEEFK